MIRGVWNVRRKIAWLVIIPLAILAALALSLPLILNSADYKALLIEQAEFQLGRTVEVGRAQVEVFPHVRITLEDVTIREPGSQETFVSAERLFLDLRVFPLLANKVVVKRIELNRPTVTIKRGAAGLLNVSDLFSKGAQPADFTTPMLGDELSLTDGECIFEDSFGVEMPRTITLQHVTTTVKRVGAHLNFTLAAALSHEETAMTFTVTGQAVRETRDGARPGGKATGQVEAKGVRLNQLAQFLNDAPLFRAVVVPVDLASAFDYQWATGDRALVLTDMRVTAAETVITGEVALQKLFTPQMVLAASLSSTPFRLETLVNSLSSETIQSYALEFLKEGQASGSLQVASLQVGWAPEQTRPLTVTGTVELLGASAVVGAHLVPLSDLKGRLLLGQDRITIEQVTGKYGEAVVTSGQGEVTRLAGDPHLSLNITGIVSASELAVIVARFAPQSLLPLGPSGLTALQGETTATVKLDGLLNRLDDLLVEWTLDAHDVGFTDQRLALPFSGIQGQVSSVPRGVRFERLAGRVGRSALALDGTIAVHSDEKAHYALTASSQADVRELLGEKADGRSTTVSADDRAEVTLNLSGKTGALRGRVKVAGPPALVKHLTATLAFEGDRIQSTIDASGLDLARLVPSGERSALRESLESFLDKGRLAVTLALRKARYQGWAFDEIHATVAGHRHALVLDPITGRMDTGILTGQSRISLPIGKPAAVDVTLHLQGIAVEPVFRSLGIKDPPFTGTMTLKGAIRGNGAHPQGTPATVNGDVRLVIKKGYSQKLSPTAKIIRLLDIPSVLAGKAEVSEKGMPFDCMSGRVVITNGVADIQGYRLDSPIMTITGAGTYHIPKDQYEMVMVVTPFGSSETLLQSIPLFGKLFAGEREGFSTAFFEIKGPLANPTVTWLPMKSVASGITGLGQLAFDFMKNIVLLPKELLSPSEEVAPTPCSIQ